VATAPNRKSTKGENTVKKKIRKAIITLVRRSENSIDAVSAANLALAALNLARTADALAATKLMR
jgi:hypothetical protein